MEEAGRKNSDVLKWWLRSVGSTYLFFLGIAAYSLMTDPAQPEVMASMWAQVPVGTLDTPAVEALALLLVFPALYFLVAGVLMLFYSHKPREARVIAIVVVAMELFAWVPTDLYSIFVNGWAWDDIIGLLLFHVVLGLSGVAAIAYSRLSPQPQA